MVKEKKLQEVEGLVEIMKKYHTIGTLDLFEMPSKQLQQLKKTFRERLEIKVAKKSLIERALKKIGKDDLEKIFEFEAKVPALIFSEMNPFKLYQLLEKNRSPTYAKEGDIAPENIIISEGETKLPAGPAIGELQRAKIPASVKEGKIHVLKDTIVVKEGEKISSEVAGLLKKLEIQPMEVGLNLLGAWEEGFVFGKDVLSISVEEYLDKIRLCYNNALNLCVGVGYLTKESMKIMIRKAYINAKSLGMNTGILEKEFIEDLLLKANIQAKMLKKKVGD